MKNLFFGCLFRMVHVHTHTHTLGELCVENIEHTGMVDKWQNNTYSLDRARVFIPSECADAKVHFISNHEKTEPHNQEQV